MSAASDVPRGAHGTAALTVLAVEPIPEVRPGADLAALILAARPLPEPGDVLVVTSKVVSKAEGRLVPAPTDPTERAELRRELVLEQAGRVVAQRGSTLITQDANGLVQAAAGVDGSNVESDELALLPEHPDASAVELRRALAAALGFDVPVVLTDTMGRAWRRGQIDQAIGASGLPVLIDYAGAVDRQGNALKVTQAALADELAAAADLVKGKLGGTPVALVRGLSLVDDGSSAHDLVRAREEDFFWLGADDARAQGREEAVLLRRSIRTFTDEPVPAERIEHALRVALTAPAPHHSAPVRFVHVRERRTALLDAMAEAWRADLAADGRSADEIGRRVARGELLYRAPELVLAFLTDDGRHTYPDDVRNRHEHTMFRVAGGAAVQSLLVALAADGIGSCWVGSTIFAPEVVTEQLALPRTWEPLGAIAIGYPVEPLTARPLPEADGRIVVR